MLIKGMYLDTTDLIPMPGRLWRRMTLGAPGVHKGNFVVFVLYAQRTFQLHIVTCSHTTSASQRWQFPLCQIWRHPARLPGGRLLRSGGRWCRPLLSRRGRHARAFAAQLAVHGTTGRGLATRVAWWALVTRLCRWALLVTCLEGQLRDLRLTCRALTTFVEGRLQVMRLCWEALVFWLHGGVLNS